MCIRFTTETNIMENQQDYILNNNQVQVLLTGYYGDGHLKTKNKKFTYITSSITKSSPVSGMMYKMWSSTTSQQWRKLQAELKSKGQVMTKRAFTNELYKRLAKI